MDDHVPTVTPRLHLVTLSVGDLGASLDFYERVFGWTPAWAADTTAFLDLGPVLISLYTGLDAEVGRAEGPPAGAVALAHNVASEAEVDAILQHAERTGARIASPATRHPWGGYTGYLADPDGHLWEIAHNPDWTIDDDGLVQPSWRTG